ncbi:MAG: YdcF family protein [Cyanobacteria bacterium P01_F01_bin.56]
MKLLPEGDVTKATAVVVLGRGSDSRLERSLVAAQLSYEQSPISIFVSGMSDAPEILDHLQDMGVSEQNIAGERCSQTTWENALFSDILMGERDKESVILLTDEPHLLRSYLVFKGFELNVVPYGVQEEQSGLFSLKQAGIILREYAALVAYAGSGKLWPKSEKEQKIDELDAQQKVTSWGCQL